MTLSDIEPKKQGIQSKTDKTDINYVYYLQVVQEALLERLITECTENHGLYHIFKTPKFLMVH